MNPLHLLLLVFIAFVRGVVIDQSKSSSTGYFVLNSQNFNKVLQSHRPIFIKFYAPWCQHCKDIEQDYKQTANQLKDVLSFAELDCSDQLSFCQMQNITGFPTLKLYFTNNDSLVYSGQRKALDMVKYLQLATQPLTTVVKMEDLVNLLKKTGVVLAYKGTNQLTQLKYVSLVYQGIDYAILDQEFSNTQINSVNEAFIIFTEQGTSAMASPTILEGETTPTDIIKYIELNSYKDVNLLSERVLRRIWDPTYENTSLLVILPSGSNEFTQILSDLKRENPQIFIAYVIFNQWRGTWGFLQEKFGADTMKNGPAAYLIEGKEKIKYAYHRKIDSIGLHFFLKLFNQKKLQIWYKSEKSPSNSTSTPPPVGTIPSMVGSQFSQLIQENKQNVLLLITINFCSQCKELEQIVSRVAKRMVKSQPPYSTQFFKINGQLNEIPGQLPKRLPELRLYFPKDIRPSGDYIFFDNINKDTSVDDIHKFILQSIEKELALQENLKKPEEIDQNKTLKQQSPQLNKSNEDL